MTLFKQYVEIHPDDNKKDEVSEMVTDNKRTFVKFLDEADEKKKPPVKKDGDFPRNEKGEPDHTGTGVKPEDGWKTPEQREADAKNAEIAQKDQEEMMVQAEKDKLQKRHDLVRSKLGRILATPEELEELDAEREEQDKIDAKKEQLRSELKQKKLDSLGEAQANVKKKADPKVVKKGTTKAPATKSNTRATLIDKLKKQGYEAKARGVWATKAGKRGRITPDNKWEEIKDETPAKTPAGKETKKSQSSAQGGKVQPTVKAKPALRPISQIAVKTTAKKEIEKEWEEEKKEKKKKIEKELKGLKNSQSNSYLNVKETGADSINSIDGKIKMEAVTGKRKAPGNKSSQINEIGIGYGIGELLKNPKTSIDVLSNLLYKQFIKTKTGSSNGEEKTKNACYAAAISAVAEANRIKGFLKEHNLKEKDCVISHIWGSKESLEATCDYLDNPEIKTVNGKDKEGYKQIVRDGGAGDNPTDTMILIHKKNSKEAFILHTSNKTSTKDIQGNSSPEKVAENVIKLLNKDNVLKGKDKEGAQKLSEKYISDIKDANTEIVNLIQKQTDNVVKKISTEAGLKETLDVIKTMSSGGDPAKYWGILVKKHSGLDGSVTVENGEVLIKGKRLTKDQQQDTLKNFLSHANKVSLSDDDEMSLTKDENTIITKLAPPPQDKLNELYGKQFDLQNKFRKNLNKISNGIGDQYYSKVMLSRLHIDGKEHGGIPKGFLEVNMGNNDSGVKYDAKGEVYQQYDVNGKKGYYRCNMNGERIGKVPVASPNSLSNGEAATVINEDVLEVALGGKGGYPPDGKGINVGTVEWKDSAIGVANIYSKDNKVIGFVTYRSKSGKGGRVQDTISFHPDFQKKLQLLSHYKSKDPEKYKKLQEHARKTGNVDTKKFFGESRDMGSLFNMILNDIIVTESCEFIPTNFDDIYNDDIEDSKLKTHFESYELPEDD